MKPNLKDALLSVTKALPNGAATTTSDPLQLHDGTTTNREFAANVELLVTAPALTTGQLPDGQTITYTVETSNTADFAVAKAISGPLVQTGAAGAGAVTAEMRVRPPSDAQTFTRLKQVKTGAADASAKSGTLELVF